MKSSTVSYLSFENGIFNLMVDCLMVKDFTSDLWYQRASPKKEKVTLDDNSKFCIKCQIGIYVIASDPVAIRSYVAKAFNPPDSHCRRGPGVWEISISDQQSNLETWNYPRCTTEGELFFHDINDLKVALSGRVFTASAWSFKEKKTKDTGECFRFRLQISRSLHRSTCMSKDQNRDVSAIHSLYYSTIVEMFQMCFAYHKSPLIIRGVRELARITEAIISSLSNVNEPHLHFMLNLFPPKFFVGHKYTWRGERDLLFSHWAPGEPRDISTKKCVRWDFVPNGTSWIDRKWHSTECVTKPLQFGLCQQNIPPVDQKLYYTYDFAIKNTGLLVKSHTGQLLSDETKQRGEFVSMSVTVASGYLHRPLGDLHGHRILGLVSKDILVLKSKSDHSDLLEQLSPLFHQCGDDQDDQVHHPWGVPLSLVCDGKMDCQSGSDESFCGFFGEIICSRDLFQCKSGQCVPLEARCDLLVDCQDKSDEVGCEQECQHKECKSGQCLPRPWFHDGMVDCKDGSDEDGDPPVSDICVFICNRTMCVTKQILNDSVVDCTGPEGPLDETLGALEPFTCTSQDSSSTYLDKWAPKCVLARDLFGQIIGCRDFQHLSNCKHFTCPTGYVKCPNSFCIPLVNVKDGKEECEKGEDEGTNPLPDLENYFQCNPWKPQAVPLSAVCDARRDCPHGEDELDCGHHDCPRGFICLSGAVSVFRYNKSHPLRNLSFIHPDTRYLDLSGALGVHDFFNIYPKHHLRYLRSLNLSGCQISSLIRGSQSRTVPVTEQHRNIGIHEKSLEDFRMVKTIDLSHNKLVILPDFSYLNLMPNLEELNLTHNAPLSVISRESFTNLKMLQFLDLSFTSLTRLDHDVWDELISLEKLSLKGTLIVSIKFTLPATIGHFNVELTNIADVGGEVFSKLRGIKDLRSSSYKLCCPAVLGYSIPTHVCNYEGRAISSCEHLIKEPVLRAVVWLVGLSTLVGNAVTLVYRLVWEREVLKKPYGLFVTNLGVSDFLMGVYLLIIAIADASFYGEYVLYDYTWRNNRVCETAGVLVTMSSLTSILFISLITVERYLAVRYPYGEFRLSDCTVKAAVLGAWMFGLTAAIIPLMPFARHWKVYSSNGMCVALPLSTERRPGQWYGATFFVGVDFILFIFIGVGQGFIYKTVKENGKRTRKHSNPLSQLHQNQRIQEFTIAKQLSLVVMTDFLCWFPIITMGLMALSGVDMGDAAYRWSALLVLPINSALNPLLYTVPEIRKRWEDYKEARRQAKMLVLAARRRRRLRHRSVVRKQSRRQLVRRACQALNKIRQEILARPQRVHEARMLLSILSTKVIRLESTKVSKRKQCSHE